MLGLELGMMLPLLLLVAPLFVVDRMASVLDRMVIVVLDRMVIVEQIVVASCSSKGGIVARSSLG